ncbi:serine/threonine-protein kinase [Lentisphaera araneosa HTCC2155]|uniref:Serine/threonine-protein kinase n=1 Tax=Lentisphaera araneosa HTCC2155 TaxID=313628 RepID=A6DJ12_9BACT|nr:protein kinase [Lentisphaera araneosa]EDM28448.1 serine/threonine-protein kinase [Lentisphaera araneosa HTCC2155]
MSSDNNTSAFKTIKNESELNLWKKNNLNSAQEDARYSDLSLLSSNESRNTYSAYDKKFNRSVTLIEALPDTQNEIDFINEILFSSSFDHPSIIKLLDFGVWKENTPYYTIQQGDFQPLNEYIDKTDDSEIKKLTLFSKVCDALSYAHSRQITHQKLDLENILLGPNDELLLEGWKMGENIDTKSCDDLANDDENIDQEANEKTSQDEESNKDESSKDEESKADEPSSTDSSLDIKPDLAALGLILKKLYTKTPEDDLPETISDVISQSASTEADQAYQSVDELKSDMDNFIQTRMAPKKRLGLFRAAISFYYEYENFCFPFMLLVVGLVGYSSYSYKKLYEAKIVLDKSSAETKAENKHLNKVLKYQIKANDKYLLKELKTAKALMAFPHYSKSPKAATQQALEIYLSQKDLKKYHKEMFMILLIQQDFKAIFKHKIKVPGGLMRLAKMSSNKAKDENGILKNEKDFVNILHTANNLPFERQEFKEQYIERAILYKNEIEQETEISPMVLKQLIRVWNPDWLLKDFYFNAKHKSLRLKGASLTNLVVDSPNSMGQPFLNFLKFNNLDMRQAGIESLDQLDGQIIKRLDIRETAIKDFPIHENALKVETLVITPGQFTQGALKQVPSTVNVIQKKQ